MSGSQGDSDLERRIAERVELSVKVHWTRLTQDKVEALLRDGLYSELSSFTDFSASTSQEALERQAYTQNVSVTGMRLLGDLRLSDGSALEEGWELLVDIQMTGGVKPVRTLATVVWISPPDSIPRQAGLFFIAVNKEDIERVVRKAA